MAPWFSTVYFIGVLIPTLLFATRYLLLPFFGSFYRSLLDFRTRNHLQTAEAPAVKDGLDVIYEGPNPEVE
jgi:hypothetical protein